MRQERILVHRRSNKLVPDPLSAVNSSTVEMIRVVYAMLELFLARSARSNRLNHQAHSRAGSFGKGRLSQVIRVQIEAWQACNSGYALRPLR